MVNIAQAEIGLGQTSAGLADTAKVQAIAEQSSDQMYAAALTLDCAQLYAYAGRAEQAVTTLSKALAAPGIGSSYSPVMLWIDPIWDPIHKDPGFKSLKRKYAKYRPVTVPEASRT